MEFILQVKQTLQFSEVEQWVTSKRRFSFKTTFFLIIEREKKIYSERRVYGNNLQLISKL
jgi:hypothetical protein